MKPSLLTQLSSSVSSPLVSMIRHLPTPSLLHLSSFIFHTYSYFVFPVSPHSQLKPEVQKKSNQHVRLSPSLPSNKIVDNKMKEQFPRKAGKQEIHLPSEQSIVRQGLEQKCSSSIMYVLMLTWKHFVNETHFIVICLEKWNELSLCSIFKLLKSTSPFPRKTVTRTKLLTLLFLN